MKIIKSYKIFESINDISLDIRDILSDVSDSGYKIHVEARHYISRDEIFIAIIPFDKYHTPSVVKDMIAAFKPGVIKPTSDIRAFFKNINDYNTFIDSFYHLEEHLKEIGFSLSKIDVDYLHTNHYRLLITFKRLNNHIKEWSEWNPVLNKKVKEYVELNKQHLTELWDDEKSEEENMQFLIDYFTEYPDEMNSVINPDKVKTVTPTSGITNTAPILQNIGGVKDFKSF
jgi:hypothetical protein